jgi:hypothetical protein
VEKPKIRFINTRCETLFFVEDGGEIEIGIDGGEMFRFACRYIDDYHARIGNWIYHIREFAETMERNNHTSRPVPEQEYGRQARLFIARLA